MKHLKSEATVYELEKQAGEGLTATVFKAIRRDSQGHSRQTVALKILKDKTAIPWLRREFDALARVDSPFCVRVLAWENIELGCALVLEWIEGVTLFELCRFEQPSEPVLNEIVAQVGKGLHDLAQARLHHGDLSPKNILIDRQGRVKIVDFATPVAGSKEIRGTAPYLAPEIWRGESTSYSGDLFALGLIHFDARNSFQRISSIQEARERAFKMSSDQPGLLCREPQQRCLLQTEQSIEAQCELGRSVVRCMEAREAASIQTAVFSPSQIGPDLKSVLSHRESIWTRHKAIPLLIASLCLSAPVLAEAPLVPADAPAVLSVSSHKWLSLSLNGREVGYTPIKLRLAPGRHRLIWRGRRIEGQLEITLLPGQHLHLASPENKRYSGR